MSDGLIRPMKIGLHTNVPSRVFKYVDVADATYLSAGNLKIGTLRGYAALEGSRADKFEASVTHTLNFSGSIFPGSDEAKALETYGMFAIGPDSALIGVNFEDCTSTVFSEDSYCLRFSLSGEIKHPDNKIQAVYEVLDLEKVIRRLGRIHNFDEAAVGLVDYKSRVRGDMLSKMAGPPDPFTKPVEYKWEQEVRVLFRPKVSHLEKYLAKPDKKLKHLMVRRPNIA